jgi:hypothetical protein
MEGRGDRKECWETREAKEAKEAKEGSKGTTRIQKGFGRFNFSRKKGQDRPRVDSVAPQRRPGLRVV